MCVCACAVFLSVTPASGHACVECEGQISLH